MDRWMQVTEKLAEELKCLVDSAGTAANTALRENSLALYYRFVSEERVIGGSELIHRVLDLAVDNLEIGRSIRDDWQARRTAIANAGDEFRGAVRAAADKFLQIVKENHLKA